MTTKGEMRRRYSREIEPAPSRFTPEYRAWVVRADLWAEEQQ